MGPVLTGGIGFLNGSGLLVGSEDPVRSWTTCLKEEVSAWTKVVGYELFGSELLTCTGGDTPLLLLLLFEVMVLWVFGDGIRNG